jgi:hypothetical protein
VADDAGATSDRATDNDRYPVFKVMDVMGVAVDLPDQYPVVTLQETEPPLRRLAFPIGLPEGVALAYALRKVDTPRPLTHDLMATMARRFGADVVAVRLIGRRAGTYLAELDFMGRDGRVVIPCRPSDGLALALRQAVPAPVLADERLFEGTADVAPPETPPETPPDTPPDTPLETPPDTPAEPSPGVPPIT